MPMYMLLLPPILASLAYMPTFFTSNSGPAMAPSDPTLAQLTGVMLETPAFCCNSNLTSFHDTPLPFIILRPPHYLANCWQRSSLLSLW